MTRRTRRLASLAAAVLLPLSGLAACGDDEGSGSGSAGSSEGAGLDAVTVEGEVGQDPEVTFDGKVDPSELESEVVTEGDGEAVEDGDSVLVHVWIGNGFDQKKTFSTYDAGKPELFTAGSGSFAPVDAALDGNPVGSRVVVASSAQDAFGEQGNPQLGIGNEDGVVFVVDLVSEVATEPNGKDVKPAAWAPEVQEKDGVVTGFDFSGAPEPTDKLRETLLVEGDGAEVKQGQTIYVNYLGQVYGGKKPFDDSYSRGEPTSFPIGVGQVVKGWDQSLVGEKVGSRVLVAIPPELGYGTKGNPQAGIKGTDTLYFVVDVLAAV